MERCRRILVAVQPGVLEGALANLLSVAFPHAVVQRGNGRLVRVRYNAAVVSDELPEGVQADVVITLPDTRGSGGRGTIRTGATVTEVPIGGADGLVELLGRYVSRPGA